MGYRIVFVVAAVVAQAPAPAPKAQEKAPAADQELKEARRFLQNGRYAEAEEALTAILADAKKDPARLTPARKVAIVLDLAECQASQGEYAKAIERLKATEAEESKNADLPARLAELYLTRGDWEAADAAMRRAEKIDPDHLLRAGSRLGCTTSGATSTRRSPPANGSSTATTIAARRSSRTPLPCSWSARLANATTAPTPAARSLATPSMT